MDINILEYRDEIEADSQLSVRVNHEASKEQLPPNQTAIYQATPSIKQAQDCELFQTIKLGKKLGEGAYGEVFQALWPAKHKFIVVKKIALPEHLANMQSKQSLDILSEIQMLTKLQHDNIVKYYDSCVTSKVSEGNHSKEIHIYMEYMN